MTGIESTEGLSEFIVLPTQLLPKSSQAEDRNK